MIDVVDSDILPDMKMKGIVIEFPKIFTLGKDFLINIAAGVFLGIYISPTIFEKINGLLTCVGCLIVAYLLSVQSNKN